MNTLKLIAITLIFVSVSFSAPSAKSRLPESEFDITLSFAPLVKRISPAVVNVYASKKVVQRSPFAGDPFFERFFGRDGYNRPRLRNKNSLGSGVIVDKSGIVITNHHVIKSADKVKVVLADGKEYDADIMLKDDKADLAVLQIRSKDKFPIIPIGDSDDLEVGDLILAVGNPFGVGQTVTSGIISALARSQIGVSDFGFFIQTDAAINPGNSGGALVDMRGQLIGINTAIFSKSGGSHGIGFAIPSNMVKVVLRSTESGGDYVTRPWIGATFQTVTSDIAENLGLKRPRGAMVVGIVKGGPAEDAGLRVGDVILAVNEQKVKHPDALGYRIATIGIGNDAKITVLSRRKRKILDISLKAAPETIPRRKYEIGGRNPFSGATVYNLSPATAEELGMDGDKSGVVVVSVRSRSFAHQYRLRKLDIIRNINRQEITGTRQLKRFLNQRQQIWEFVIERKGRLLRQIVR
ncbi:MAG: DegQ family serine endoprotease [Hyphomicrobiales bacterium]|nr:DegQ family serine endoprotease [Hyphomicrobiales bacterium]